MNEIIRKCSNVADVAKWLNMYWRNIYIYLFNLHNRGFFFFSSYICYIATFTGISVYKCLMYIVLDAIFQFFYFLLHDCYTLLHRCYKTVTQFHNQLKFRGMSS